MTRVLVIDDEPSILRALRINLTARNYEVSTASDGASSLAAISRERPTRSSSTSACPTWTAPGHPRSPRLVRHADHRLVGVGGGAPEGRGAGRRSRRLRHEAVRHGRVARSAQGGGRPPAEADLQRHFGVRPPSVHQMVLTLERAGLIRRQPGLARSIEVLIAPELLPVLR